MCQRKQRSLLFDQSRSEFFRKGIGHWRKTLKVGFGAHNDVCGDRMPLININKDEILAFHIIACAGGSNKAYTTSKDSKFPDRVKIDL